MKFNPCLIQKKIRELNNSSNGYYKTFKVIKIRSLSSSLIANNKSILLIFCNQFNKVYNIYISINKQIINFIY